MIIFTGVRERRDYVFIFKTYFRSPKETISCQNTAVIDKSILEGNKYSSRKNWSFKCEHWWADAQMTLSFFMLPQTPNIHISWPGPQNYKLALKIMGPKNYKFRDHFMFLPIFEAINFNIIKLFLAIVWAIHLLTKEYSILWIWEIDLHKWESW